MRWFEFDGSRSMTRAIRAAQRDAHVVDHAPALADERRRVLAAHHELHLERRGGRVLVVDALRLHAREAVGVVRVAAAHECAKCVNAACTAGKGPDSDTTARHERRVRRAVHLQRLLGHAHGRRVRQHHGDARARDASYRSASESTMASAAGVGTTNVDFIAWLASICPGQRRHGNIGVTYRRHVRHQSILIAAGRGHGHRRSSDSAVESSAEENAMGAETEWQGRQIRRGRRGRFDGARATDPARASALHFRCQRRLRLRCLVPIRRHHPLPSLRRRHRVPLWLHRPPRRPRPRRRRLRPCAGV